MAYQVQYVCGDATPTGLVPASVFDGTDLIVGGGAGDNSVRAYSFNGLALTHRVAISPAANPCDDLCFDGTYYYSMQNNSNRIYALSLNKALWTWTNINNYNFASSAGHVAYDGTYLHCGYTASKLRALTFNGAAFTAVGAVYTLANNASRIQCANGFIYVLCTNGTIYAFTFNGISYTLVGSVACGPSVTGYVPLVTSGNYIIAAVRNAVGSDIFVYTFDGVNFNLVTSIDVGSTGTANGICFDGTYIHYVDSATNILYSYEFDGATLTLRGSVAVGNTMYAICNNASYLFLGLSAGATNGEVQVFKMTLRAQIAASPTSGIAPLTVSFVAS